MSPNQQSTLWQKELTVLKNRLKNRNNTMFFKRKKTTKKFRIPCSELSLNKKKTWKSSKKKNAKKKLFVWKNMENKRVYFPVDWRYCWCKAINLAINCGYTNAIEWDLCKFVFSLWSSLSSSFWSNGWFFCSFDGGYCDFDTVHCHGTDYFASNLFARISLHKKNRRK